MAAETSDGAVLFVVATNVTDSRLAAIFTAEAQLKDIVQNLYNLIVQSYDHRGSQTQEAMKREMYAFPSYILQRRQLTLSAASLLFRTW